MTKQMLPKERILAAYNRQDVELVHSYDGTYRYQDDGKMAAMAFMRHGHCATRRSPSLILRTSLNLWDSWSDL